MLPLALLPHPPDARGEPRPDRRGPLLPKRHLLLLGEMLGVPSKLLPQPQEPLDGLCPGIRLGCVLRFGLGHVELFVRMPLETG